MMHAEISFDPVPISPAQHRILIVDDDAALLEALPTTLALRLVGVAVDCARDAKAALELIRTRHYDLVMTDLKMPGLDGLALLRRIAHDAMGVPVVLMTGHGTPHLAHQARELGAVCFLEKPLDRDTLIRVIRDLLTL
jgi:DNA-binding NtrC family response regulator